MRIFKNFRTVLLILIDLAVLTSVFGTIVFLNEIVHNGSKGNAFVIWMDYLIAAVVFLGVRIAIGVYSNVWRYANTVAYFKMVLADAVSGIAVTLVTVLISQIKYGSWEIVSLFAVSCVVTLLSRFVYQLLMKKRELSDGIDVSKESKKKINVAIVGAGRTGALLAEELLNSSHSTYKPVCFFDIDPHKFGGTVCGIKVFSAEKNMQEVLAKHDVSEAIIAIPSKEGEAQRAVIDYYSNLGCKVKIYGFPVGAASDSSKRVVREIGIDDLLFRDAINIVDTEAAGFYRDKTVLVTGGGGSIGSELCRQIAKCAPKRLIIVDIYENNAYDIQQELKRQWGDKLDLCVEIASVRERARLDTIFAYYRPEIVFHAAAHKHVPLMEHSNAEAIKNNVFGTKNTADVAEKYGVEKFILVSTDKAVNPTNVMGASKRMCEMVIGCRKDSNTTFAAVRFGNVLGSNGSVIPLFKRQIAAGGPVTITDRRIIRYFMTIPEASGLVIQAGAMAKCGELFVLDMGKPVKIIDLAENMITLSGLHPYIDIDIVEVGLRPGEKLYEELLIKTENLSKTKNNLIFIEKDAPLTREEVEDKLSLLREAVEKTESRSSAPEILSAMMQVVPTYRLPEEINKNAQNSEEMKLASTV